MEKQDLNPKYYMMQITAHNHYTNCPSMYWTFRIICLTYNIPGLVIGQIAQPTIPCLINKLQPPPSHLLLLLPPPPQPTNTTMPPPVPLPLPTTMTTTMMTSRSITTRVMVASVRPASPFPFIYSPQQHNDISGWCITTTTTTTTNTVTTTATTMATTMTMTMTRTMGRVMTRRVMAVSVSPCLLYNLNFLIHPPHLLSSGQQ